jgi:SAM-dependent methyltransferase
MMDGDPTSEIQRHNQRVWDERARRGQAYTEPLTDEELFDPARRAAALHWLGGDVRSRRVLCLAAGGGRHGVLYALAGAQVTVVDLSSEMLGIDRDVAAARGASVQTVQASMDDMPMFAAGWFDFVVQPVSTCYVPDIGRVYAEVARILAGGGVYISQHKSPTSLQADTRPSARGYELIEPYYRQGPLPRAAAGLLRESGALEYLHRWDELVGGLCRAGFVIEDMEEPRHADPQAAVGTLAHRSCYIAPYVRIKARRVANSTRDGKSKGDCLVLPAVAWPS